ncbi:MAG: lipid-A-disaccharide synthase [Bryobacterales bacterium]|nr:lipid-A-disaccharide synthase [Bryobacterales bacterium]MDE0262247.1 lipid-A-disaccharide synthase [Bryobacterales bacterium]MDE0624745.1 lipid-A-disaccharide synthase [Bryobacterales bacterium]
MRILVSAGETSGDRYAAGLVEALAARLPDAHFFGCAGPKMRAHGVEAVVRTEDLAVVGLFEVARHIPRIYGLFRKLDRSAATLAPDLAILTDAPDFNLRLAARLRRAGIPVVYYVAPQVWAWRKRRIHRIREVVDLLLVIFPFEESYFRERGVDARFVGHPLCDLAKVSSDRADFLSRHSLSPSEPLVALLPGSRKGESLRHLPALEDAARRLTESGVRQFVLPASATTGKQFFDGQWKGPETRIVENNSQDCIGHADVALVASGSATVETALLGTPMVSFYRLSWSSYYLARLLVDVQYYTMVNLLAGKQVIAECIQHECTGTKLASEAIRLLKQEGERRRMITEFSSLRGTLQSSTPAADRAATAICERFSIG